MCPDYYISGCELQVLSSVMFVDEMSRLGLAQGSHLCPNCCREYKSKWALVRHLRYECNKAPSFLCTCCPFKSKRKDNLRQHMALKHNVF